MRVSQFRNKVDALLSEGLAELSMSLGVLARIENNYYEIVAVQSSGSGAYVTGEKYHLGHSYSRETFERRQIVARTNIEDATITLRHPLYRSLPLESYLGAPITIDGEPWGCLDFCSMAPRNEEFGEAELKLIDALAGEISQLLSATAQGASQA